MLSLLKAVTGYLKGYPLKKEVVSANWLVEMMMARSCLGLLVLCLSNCWLPIEAFGVPPRCLRRAQKRLSKKPSKAWRLQPSSISGSAIHVTILPDDFEYDRLNRGLNEMHRRERRDFFNHESWVRHRSPPRFFDNLLQVPFSKVVWMIANEITIITFISVFLIAWNHLLVLGYEDFAGVLHEPIVPLSLPFLSLPAEPFLLSSPALALLLGRFYYCYVLASCYIHVT